MGQSLRNKVYVRMNIYAKVSMWQWKIICNSDRVIVSIGHTVCDNVNLMLTLQKDQCDINVNVWDDKVYIRISTYVTKSEVT